MAKILKQLVFGQKKNPPAPPRPDYEGEKANCQSTKFADHDYENLPRFSGQNKAVAFEEKKKELIVFQDYSEPADLQAEIAALRAQEEEDLYTAPIDEAPQHSCTEEDMYCVPYEETNESAEKITSQDRTQAPTYDHNTYVNSVAVAEQEDAYDVVPDLSDDPTSPRDEDDDEARPCDEYDEPWEWSVGHRLTSSLQVSPSSPLSLEDVEERTYSEPATESLLSDSCDESCDEDEMTTRQRRLYETAFDSRVKRDVDDIDDRLSPVIQLQGDHLFHGRTSDAAPVARAASRSSFGSTSGSSASSTPTHQPMVIARQSPRQRHLPLHFTPTERRKVTLFRDLPARSQSPQARLLSNNRNLSPSSKMAAERKSPFGSHSHHWDNASDRSSSLESMDQQKEDNRRLSTNNSRNERDFMLGKSDNLVFRNSTTNHQSSDWKDSKLENSNGFHKNVQEIVMNNKEDRQDELNSFVNRKNSTPHTVLKVVPTDNACLLKCRSKTNPSISDSCPKSPPDMALKENTSQNVASNLPDSENRPSRRSRPFSLATDSSSLRPLDNVLQSPVNDHRPSEDYDPPWEFKSKPLRPSVNGSISVPERLFQPAFCESQLPSSVTHDKLDSAGGEGCQNVAPKSLSVKPHGPLSKTNLNLNLNLNSDSPRKARQGLTLNFGCAALSAVGEKVDAELTLEKQGWYHGSISRLDAENLLRVLKEGSYLVRNSESSKQDYSLSLKSARGFMHMKIVHSDGRFILGQFSNPFASIPEMIHHYSLNKLPIKGAEHMSLLYPVIDQLL